VDKPVDSVDKPKICSFGILGEFPLDFDFKGYKLQLHPEIAKYKARPA
jgi:hypothetical protein